MLDPGKRLTAYLVIATLLVIGIGLYFDHLEGQPCLEADTGRCEFGVAFIVVSVAVLVTVMPFVVFFGEMSARDRRRRPVEDPGEPVLAETPLIPSIGCGGWTLLAVLAAIVGFRIGVDVSCASGTGECDLAAITGLELALGGMVATFVAFAARRLWRAR